MPKILAFTPTYTNRAANIESLCKLRSRSGVWYDHFVACGSPTLSDIHVLDSLLYAPDQRGIQHLCCWRENRGQHHATKLALDFARANGYDWLLRMDDDIQPKTQNWLTKLIDRTLELRQRARDERLRIIAAPRLVGLKHPIKPSANIELGQPFPAVTVPILGGGCRLHPVEFLSDYTPPLMAPLGRRDPESIADYALSHDGLLVQYPDIRVWHDTAAIEQNDTPAQAHARVISRYWPYIETSEA